MKWRKALKSAAIVALFAGGFALGITDKPVEATNKCNCVVYTCYPSGLECKGTWNGQFCDYIDLTCPCPPCP